MAAVMFPCYTFIIQSSYAPLEVFISSSVSGPYVMGLSITITLSLDCIGYQADYEACVPIKLFTSMHQCQGEKEVVERDSGEYGTYRKCSKGAVTGQLLPLSLYHMSPARIMHMSRYFGSLNCHLAVLPSLNWNSGKEAQMNFHAEKCLQMMHWGKLLKRQNNQKCERQVNYSVLPQVAWGGAGLGLVYGGWGWVWV